MEKFIFRRSFAIILASLMMFILSACSTEESRLTEEYVSSVKELVDDCVSNTRILKTQTEEFDCNDSESSEEYIETLNELVDLYGSLAKLSSPGGYDDLNTEVKSDSEEALSCITQMLSLAEYAVSNGDDSFYLKDIDSLYEEYQECYDSLVSLSLDVQTKYRNS